MSIDGLILDFGEVLTRSQPPGTIERMAALANLPRPQLEAQYWRHRADYDAGLTGEEYWRRVLEGTGSAEPEQLRNLIEADFLSWSDFRPEVWDIAAEFRARGGRTAMLSNGVAEIVARLRDARPLERWFDVVIVSCEVGQSKPAPEIYRTCLQRLGVPAESTLFVDDRVENLRGAVVVGLRTLHFTGDASVLELRRTLGLAQRT